MKERTATRFLAALMTLAMGGVLSAAQPARPQLKIDVRVLGQKFVENLDVRELEKQAARKLVDVLTPQITFATFSATDGDTVLHFRLNSRGEEGVSQGDPQEIDLFISLDGPNTESGGKDTWIYREGKEHSEPIGGLEDVVEKIAFCAQAQANFESLVRNVLGHLVLGRGGLLQLSPEMRWIFPFGLSEMCFAPNDTRFRVVHEGMIQNVLQRPRAYVAALGPYVPDDNQQDSDLRNRWVGGPGIPSDIDQSTHDQIQKEMDRIQRAAPGSLQVKEIYMLVYERPLDGDLCGQLFPPGTPNSATGGHGQ